jgi:hypothetical protein
MQSVLAVQLLLLSGNVYRPETGERLVLHFLNKLLSSYPFGECVSESLLSVRAAHCGMCRTHLNGKEWVNILQLVPYLIRRLKWTKPFELVKQFHNRGIQW